MAVQEQYPAGQFPVVLMGTNGTAGDPVYTSTGSGLIVRSAAGGTHLCGLEFIGLLVETTAKGSYGAVQYEGIFQMPKSATTDVIEVNDRIHIGTRSTTQSLVGTVVLGTHIGLCAKQSGSTDPNVSVLLKPAFMKL